MLDVRHWFLQTIIEYKFPCVKVKKHYQYEDMSKLTVLFEGACFHHIYKFWGYMGLYQGHRFFRAVATCIIATAGVYRGLIVTVT